jgi:translation initiation factor 1
MKKINLSDLHKVVYSTNPDYKPEEEISDIQELSPAQQTLYIRLDRLKGNKMATVVENFRGGEDALNDLAKTLKSKCGSGGSAKDGEIIIQGEKRTQVTQLLQQMGYKTKQKGG